MLWAQKLKKHIKSEIIQILQSHYPPSENVQLILLKFKMATFQLFVTVKTLTLFMTGDELRLQASYFQFEIIINVLVSYFPLYLYTCVSTAIMTTFSVR